MIELKQCCMVPFPEKLFEEYEVTENAIYANVSTSKVLDMIKRFIKMHEEPMFFILELPCREEDDVTKSKILINKNDDYDVYFIDGLPAQVAEQCINAMGAFLVRDGMNTFGIGGHLSHEEILFGKYNVMTIYTKAPERYAAFLEEFGLKRTQKLVTAWKTFSKEHPGECRRYVSEETGRTIYDIPEMYKDYGMYLYETRRGDDPRFEKKITLEELVGKVLLVGVTYYTQDDEYIEQKQFYGTVTEATQSLIRIKQKDGTEFTTPSDLSSTWRAHPGEYTLRATGEIVVNPDFIANWNVTKNPQ